VSKRPLVGVICCTRQPEDAVQGVAERYLRTAPLMQADFVLIPSMSEILDLGSIVGRLDGILLTGSPSNVAPRRYSSAEAGVGPFDPARDETTLRLIAEAVQQDRPLLGICRGFQEIAVAYGATLRRDLGEATRERVHHTPLGVPMEEMFALRHRVDLSPCGILQRALGASSITVVSAHFQGIDQMSEQLIVEATSDDGIIEAVRPAGGERVMAVQWHPEWRAAENVQSLRLFAWFGRVLRGASFTEAADQVAREPIHVR
jgi:putative glutamine amidotransferase